MGTITLIVEGTTVGTVANGGGVTLVKEVSELDSARLISAYAHSYAGRWLDAENNPRQPTIEEVLSAWWNGVVSGSLAHTLSVEKEVAAQAARRRFSQLW
jgi:hypothetical protein